MKLIIVDDEPLAVRSVVNAIDWDKLGIEHVYESFSAKQAKELFATHPIDIMLCDIEMPHESGLELLTWVRERYPSTSSIFLTCHADFGFAKEAIKLGSLDYLLKPIPPDELQAAIQKAIDHLKSQHEVMRQSESWVKHHPLFIERFWMDVLNRTIPSNPSAIQAAARERNIPLPDGLLISSVRVQVRRWLKEISLRDEKIMEYALANALQELSGDIGRNYGTIATERGYLLAMLAEVNSDKGKVKRVLDTYITNCRRFFYCDLSIYVGEPTDIHELPNMKIRLDAFMQNNVASENQVLFLQGEQPEGSTTVAWPDMKLWLLMLQDGSKERLEKEVDRYLKQLQTVLGLKALTLHQFHQDFLQIVYSVLSEKGIQAHQLFQDNLSLDLSECSADSVKNMRVWAYHLLEKALGYVEEIQASESTVGRVQAYITKHLHEDLNRENIAGLFFLHPDYINRLFKKETGQSMTDFLLQERMRAAEELLVKTDLPVTTIAVNVGYSNISYFARSFKKQYDANPNEYRQSRR